MAKLTDDDVRHLAGLAKIKLDDNQVKLFSAQLSDILKYVEQLNLIDTKGVTPTNQVTGLESVSRGDDKLSDTISHESLLEATPATQNGYIKVKRVL
jgi:aspartyl-tRNA(Asn)/glutamyl-tRNA(Gln) amidotransferase subunit C